MSNESRPGRQAEYLSVQLGSKYVSASYLSSLLRVVQAAIREVARTTEGTRGNFARQPQPVLLVPRVRANGELTLDFVFADPLDSSPLEQISAQVFDAFLDSLSDFVRRLPQPGLWGGAARRLPPGDLESELARRMDQVYVELRRIPKVTVQFQGRRIEVEGDRMEIVHPGNG